MKVLHTFATALLLVLCCVLSAFGETAVRFVHTASGAPPVTVRFSALPLFLNRTPLSASSVRSELPALSYQVQIRDTNASNPPLLHSTDMAVTDGLNQSIVFTGQPGNYGSLVLSWDKSLPQLGNIKVRFAHVAPSVQEKVTILIGGSLFFQPLDAMSATNFIEIPLAQAVNLTYVLTSSNAELAKFSAAGAFEAGNVYTVYFVDGIADREARIVNETSIDEQTPMISLQRAGVKLTLRTVNTLGTGLQTWSINGLPLFTSLSPLSASPTAYAYADGDPLIAVHPASNLSTTLAEKELVLAGANQFTLVSYGIASSMQILQLSTSASQPATGTALVRLAHTAPGTQAVEIAQENTPIITATAYGTASGFTSVQAQQQTLRVRAADTKNVLAEFSLTPASAHIYTLFLTIGNGGTEVRLLDESASSAQSPLPVLNIQSTGTAKLRAVNLIAGRSIRIGTDQGIVADRIDYTHADALKESFTAGTYIFSANDADAPDITLASIGGQIANEGNYLLVFLGSQAQAKGAIFNTAKVKLPKDSILVRFMNAAEDLNDLRIIDQTSGRLLAEKLSYGDISSYKAMPKGDRTYSLFKGSQQEVAILVDNYAAHDVLTIFIVRDKEQLFGYVLPDEAPEGFHPLSRFEATVGVDEPEASLSIVPAPHPNPASDRISMQILLSTPSEIHTQIVDMSGRIVQQGLHTYPAGSSELAINCAPLPAGFYMLILHINGKTYSYPLTIVR